MTDSRAPDEPDLPALPSEVVASLRLERDNARAPADARALAAARLAAVIPGFGGAGGGDPGGGNGESGGHVPQAANAASHAAPVARTAATIARGKALTAVVIAFALGGAGGATMATVARPEARVVYVDRAIPLAATMQSHAEEAPTIELSEPSAASASPSAVRPTALDDARTRESRLAEERKLLDRARSEIQQGNAARAQIPLEQHRVRFPNGELTEEREALAIRALAQLGRKDEARARAARFKARFPQSLLAEGVLRDVQSIP